MSRVSTVIPTYNDSTTLGTAIESALIQTVEDIEAIVVDDGSDDDPKSVVQTFDDPRVRFLEHKTNRGGSAARNTGVRAATGRYIAFLDADDEWHPEKLERQLAVLENRGKEYVVVNCGWEHNRAGALTQILNERIERPTGLEGGEELVDHLLMGRLALGGSSTLLVRASAIDAIGGWDESFPRLQDIEFTIRLLQHGKLAHVDESLVRKNDTGRPGVDTVEQAIERFLEAFDDEIADAELRGLDPEGAQRFILAKHQFESGRFGHGLRALYGSTCPHIRDALGLGLAIRQGLQTRLFSRDES